MGLNLHQLVQKIQTKNTEHTHANASVGVIPVHHFISVRCTVFPQCISYCRFPQRSPAARCCPSGLIPSTLIPAFPSAATDSPLSPSACRCCVFSPTYKILCRSWETCRKWFRLTKQRKIEWFSVFVLLASHCCRSFCVWWGRQCATAGWCYQKSRWRRRREADRPERHPTGLDTPEEGVRVKTQ